jgi:methyltransferase (TIGR00027 family)
MTSDVLICGVGKTAIDAARLRAEENRRADRLFCDPYAEVFATEAAGLIPRGLSGDGDALLEPVRLQVSARTRFFDDYLLGACAHGVRQVVLLAAGFDTRGFRLAWPDDVHLFELDLPEVLAFKERVLSRQMMRPRCRRTVVPVDLREDWITALTKAGFDPAALTAWLAEGLLVYLTPCEVTRLVTVVSEASPPGSRISFEYGIASGPPPPDQTRTGAPLDRLQALYKSGPYVYVDTSDRLAGHGWRIRLHDAACFAAARGRDAADHAIGGFLTAVR